MEQMVDPASFSIDFFFELSSVAFDGFGSRGFGVYLFLFRSELEEFLPDGLQMGYYFIWDLVVNDLKHAPIERSVVNGCENRIVIWVGEINDRDSKDLAFDGSDSGLFGLWSDKLGGESAGEKKR